MNRSMLNQIGRLLEPVRRRITNMVGRATVTADVSAGARQRAQVELLDQETRDGAEHFLPHGLISVPLAGAQGVAVFPDGDRGQPLLVVLDDRRHRPAGGDPGDVGLYHHEGAVIRMSANGNITISAKPGGKVYIDDGAGGTAKVATLADVQAVRNALNGHQHNYILPLQQAPIQPGITTGGPAVPAPNGTTVLEAK